MAFSAHPKSRYIKYPCSVRPTHKQSIGFEQAYEEVKSVSSNALWFTWLGWSKDSDRGKTVDKLHKILSLRPSIK